MKGTEKQIQDIHVLLNITSVTDAPRQGVACASTLLRRKLRTLPVLKKLLRFGDTEQGQRQHLILCRSLPPSKEEHLPSF